MPHKRNNYITALKALELAKSQTFFTRVFPANGGFFETNEGQKKVNEKVFKFIQPLLKPIN